MHLTAVRELHLQPRDVALLPTGELLAFSWSAEGMHLDAYDADLGTLWSLSIGPHALGLRLDRHGALWVVDRSGASAFSNAGEIGRRMEAPALDGLEVAALTFVDDDLVFAYQHGQNRPSDRPALVRLARNGAVRWSTRLTADGVTFERHPGDRHFVDVRRRLQPTTWMCRSFRSGDSTMSDDTLLAVYSDTRTGIGSGYAVSVTDGAVQYATKQGPIDHFAPRGAGAFLVGYMGYGAFETVLYDGGGQMQSRWDSQGYFVIRDDDTRVIETENRAISRSRLVRLMPDGTVIRGDLLDGYYTSVPYLHDDGTVYFAREGLMIAANDLRIDERIVLSRHGLPRDGVFHTRVLAGRDGLFTTWSTNRPSTSAPTSSSNKHVSGLVHVAI